LIREFRLSARGRGVSCDSDGAFVGPVPLLELSAGGRWEPRDHNQLSKQLSTGFGVPVDLSSKMGGLKEIAKALNEDDLARAQIATVLLGIPDPPLAKTAVPHDETIRLIRDLHWSGLLKLDEDCLESPLSATISANPEVGGIESFITKAGFNPDQPRNECGEWTSCGDGANAQTSDSSSSPVKPVDSKHESSWESLAHEAETAVSEIGQAEISENRTNIAASVTVANSIVNDLRAYANYRAQPWINSAGIPVQVPLVSTGDPSTDRADLIAHELFDPAAPLMRPGTNADWIDDLVDFGSIATLPIGSGLDAAGVGARAAADAIEIAADTPFIILPSELAAGFDTRLPIGRYVIPTDAVPGTTTYGNLVGKQIGDLVQAQLPDIDMILRTSPGVKGVDIEVPFDKSSSVGFQFAEIKPLTNYGFRSFNRQVARWKLPGPVDALTYDYQGNIYYGFPW